MVQHTGQCSPGKPLTINVTFTNGKGRDGCLEAKCHTHRDVLKERKILLHKQVANKPEYHSLNVNPG